MTGFDPDNPARCSPCRPYRPYRPRALELANALVRLLDLAGGRFLAVHEETLIRKACKKTGLSDFGDGSFREPLRILCRHSQTGKRMTALGRVTFRTTLLQQLVNKLMIQAELAAHPEICEEEVREPIFVLGLPRTGTTLLHRLLARDPVNRTPQYWEMTNPVPPPEPATYETDPRIKKAEQGFAILDYAAPALISMHEMHASQAEECLPLMANDLLSGLFCAPWDSPYLDWFMNLDMEHAYELHERQLKLLQWKFPNKRWVLKAPWHLYGLESLLKTYPGARIVQTHRNPLEVLPSNASLLTTMRSAFYESVDPIAIGNEVVRRSEALITRGMEVRSKEEQRGDSLSIFQDVHYANLVSDPMGTIKSIYEGFGLELSPEADERMRSYLADSPQHKHGKHRYTLEQFGLDADVVRERFRSYCERFSLDSPSRSSDLVRNAG